MVNIDISDKVGLYWVCIYLLIIYFFIIEFFDFLVNSVDKYNYYILIFLIVNSLNFIYFNKRI